MPADRELNSRARHGVIALADSAGLSVGIIADSEPLMCSMSQSFGLRGRVLKDSQPHLS